MIRAEIAVDAGDVDDRVHHRHVDGADVRARVARGERRDHQLRDADRQRAHRLRRRSTSRPSRRARGRRRAAPRRGAARRPPPRPRAIASTAAPRSPARGELGDVGAGGARDLLARDVGLELTARRARRRRRAATSTPCSRRRSRRNAYSSPFVSSVPTRTTVAITSAPRAARRRGSAAAARGRPTSSAAVVSAAIRPATITSWRSAIAVATPRFCSISRIASPSLDERLEGLDQLLDDRRREPLGGLVHDQQRRVREQRAADREHLLLAAGELRAAVPLALARGAGRARRRASTVQRPGCRDAARPCAGARRPRATGTAAGPAARSRSRACAILYDGSPDELLRPRSGSSRSRGPAGCP